MDAVLVHIGGKKLLESSHFCGVTRYNQFACQDVARVTAPCAIVRAAKAANHRVKCERELFASKRSAFGNVYEAVVVLAAPLMNYLNGCAQQICIGHVRKALDEGVILRRGESC